MINIVKWAAQQIYCYLNNIMFSSSLVSVESASILHRETRLCNFTQCRIKLKLYGQKQLEQKIEVAKVGITDVV